MARNGSGTFSLLATLAPANTVSNSSTVNSIMDDIATGLTDSINKDGTKAFGANQSMGGFKLTSVGNGTAAGDGVNAGQVQAGRLNWADGGGTADAITASYTPAVTSVTDGDLFYVRATAANATTTPTFTPNSGTVTARTIVKQGNSALAAGDIAGDGHELILRYRSSDTKYELLNPKATSATPYTVNGQTEETAAATGDFVGGYDISGTAERKFTIQNLFKVINLLTEDTSPDRAADFVITYDTSATDVKKVKPSNLAPGGMTLLGTLTTTSGASQSLTSLTLTSYKTIVMFWKGVSGSSGASMNFLVGNSTSDDVVMTQNVNNANTLTGRLEIELATGVFVFVGSETSVGFSGITGTTSPLTTSSTTISVAPSTGNFDAGSITVYGVS